MVEYLIENPLHAHIGIVIIAAIIWLNRKVRFGTVSVVADIISVLAIPFAYELYQHFSRPVPADDEGARETAFFFLGFATYGLLPMATGLGSWFFGRGIGRVIRLIYKKFS